MRRFDLYIFDFDGTLVDSFDSLFYIFTRAYNKIGIEIKREDIPYLSRVSLEEGYLKFHGDLSKAQIFGDEITAALKDKNGIIETKLFKDTIEFLQIAKKENLKIGIVTSNSVSHVKEVLDYLKIDANLFSFYVGHDECVEKKPSPEPILRGIELSGYKGDLDNICYVGDGLNDTKSANGAHVNAILIDRTNSFKDDKNYIKIKSLMDLL